MKEIPGGGYLDISPPVAEISEIAAVLLPERIPEGEILGVECPLGQDRLIGE
jgi:hypothetical protein